MDAVSKPIVLICLDGCSWEYIRYSNMTNLREIGRTGTSITCESMVPTVTNVNNASILTGKFAVEHGITGNYHYDKLSQSMIYMDSAIFLRCNTLLQEASNKGFRTLFLTVKDKLRRLLSRGATNSFSVENPSPWILKEIGKPPSIYSANSSIWLLDATLKTLEKKPYDIIYVSTTDYISHKYEPRCTEATEYMEKIDEKIGLLADKGVILGVTADHGMNDKGVKVDLQKLLSERGIKTKIVPIIKDEYVEHHQNLGGSVYLYLERDLEKALTILQDAEGVEAVHAKNETKKVYRLPSDRIGDLFVLGTRNAVFGSVDKGFYEDVNVRSHGSLHERDVPLITNQKMESVNELFNKDAFQNLLTNANFFHFNFKHS